MREAATRPAWRTLLDQLESVAVILLLSAATAALFGRTVEALAIGAAILVITEKLKVNGKPQVYVIRNSFLDPDYQGMKRNLFPIASRTIDSLIRHRVSVISTRYMHYANVTGTTSTWPTFLRCGYQKRRTF